MWKRTAIAHSAFLNSKEENLLCPPKKQLQGIYYTSLSGNGVKRS